MTEISGFDSSGVINLNNDNVDFDAIWAALFISESTNEVEVPFCRVSKQKLSHVFPKTKLTEEIPANRLVSVIHYSVLVPSTLSKGEIPIQKAFNVFVDALKTSSFTEDSYLLGALQTRILRTDHGFQFIWKQKIVQ